MLATLDDLRLFAFLAALAVYGLAGEPTPDSPGWVEAVVGLLLVLASSPAEAFSRGPAAPAWKPLAQALLFFGFSAALAVGVLNGNNPALIVRDIIPFLFMVLPLFLVSSVVRARNGLRLAVFGVALVGVAFSLRAMAIPVVSFFAPADDLAYFANAPTVLFAALVVAGFAGERFLRDFNFISLGLFAAGIIFFFVIFFPCHVYGTARRTWICAPVLHDSGISVAVAGPLACRGFVLDRGRICGGDHATC